MRMVSRTALTAICLGLASLALSGSDFRAQRTQSTSSITRPTRAPGMWIWTRADVERFGRQRDPHLLPGVLIATLVASPSGSLERRRGLSPARVSSSKVAVVVRLDDSIHRLWDRGDPFDAIDHALRLALAEARATGVTIDEIQLDYDAPSRRLRDWAKLVRRLAKSSLAEIPVWITSVPAHLEDPDYARLFAGAVVGHELQLFDTGLGCDPATLGTIRARLANRPLAFRVGVASFERSRNGRRTTAHECWSRAAKELAELPTYAGTWTFPASQEGS